jgi:hypothetical protein
MLAPAPLGTVDSSGDCSQRLEKTTSCSNVYIDSIDPPIQRAPYSPVIGPRRREMKPGTTHICQKLRPVIDNSTTRHSLRPLRSMITH